MVRARLLRFVREHYERPVVYQIEDSRDRVLERIVGRAASPCDIGSRLDDFDAEVELGRRSARRVFINDSDIESVAREVHEAVRLDFGSATTAEQR